jgi:hypothetical protein
MGLSNVMDWLLNRKKETPKKRATTQPSRMRRSARAAAVQDDGASWLMNPANPASPLNPIHHSNYASPAPDCSPSSSDYSSGCDTSSSCDSGGGGCDSGSSY